MKKILKEIKSLFIILIIALSLRATIVEAYIVPTGSMENTIMTGDFLIGNKFVYGMRTPDWIGIPYTDIGFDIPWTRFPSYKKIEKGDVTIFKYPRDNFQKYVKRCVGDPGDTVLIDNKDLYINNEIYPLSNNGKFIQKEILPKNIEDPGIFIGNNWNKDNMGPIRIPSKNDLIDIHENTDWKFLIPLMIMDGNKVSLKMENRSNEFLFTIKDPNDIARRYLSFSSSSFGKILSPLFFLFRIITFSKSPEQKVQNLFNKYYSNTNKNGYLLNPWNFKFDSSIYDYLYINDIPVSKINSYKVEQNYYWMMGDNRDDSADSRYWGFVPERLILGEAIIAYFSLNFNVGLPRFDRIGKLIL